jgi:hypothetical protein
VGDLRLTEASGSLARFGGGRGAAAMKLQLAPWRDPAICGRREIQQRGCGYHGWKGAICGWWAICAAGERGAAALACELARWRDLWARRWRREIQQREESRERRAGAGMAGSDLPSLEQPRGDGDGGVGPSMMAAERGERGRGRTFLSWSSRAGMAMAGSDLP